MSKPGTYLGIDGRIYEVTAEWDGVVLSSTIPEPVLRLQRVLELLEDEFLNRDQSIKPAGR